MNPNEFMIYLFDLLENDSDAIRTARYESDPGYIYVKTRSGEEFIIRVEET